MSTVAVVPAAHMQAANAALESQGFGPENFSVVSYTDGRASHAALHAWPDTAFSAAVAELPNVAHDEGDGDPVARTQALIEAQGAKWGGSAPDYGGVLQAGSLYRYSDESLWHCIQPYDTSVYSDHPSAYPALIRRARQPGAAEPWVQPQGAHDAYKLLDPFTSQPEVCSHKNSTWRTTVDNNVWEPGAFGWIEVGGGADEWPQWVQPTGGHDAYAVGAKVTFEGQRYTSLINGNTWSPAAYPQGWQVQP